MSVQAEHELFWRLANTPGGIQSELPLNPNILEESFLAHSKISRQRALEIYSYAYFARIAEAASEVYPALYSLLGHQDFNQLWSEYLAAFPPRRHELNRAGDRLAHFMKESQSWSEVVPAIEMATLEYSLIDTFDSEDEGCMTADEILEIQDWNSKVFQRKSDWRVLETEYTILEFWTLASEAKAMENELESPENSAQELKSEDQLPTVIPGSQKILIYRKDFETNAISIEPSFLVFLRGLERKASFGEICQDLANHLDSKRAPGVASESLKRALFLGLIRTETKS